MYSTFGLGASLKKVLNFSNMLLYAQYVVDNMEFPRGLPSIQDDMFQVKRRSHLRVQKTFEVVGAELDVPLFKAPKSLFNCFICYMFSPMTILFSLYFSAGRRLCFGRTWKGAVLSLLSESHRQTLSGGHFICTVKMKLLHAQHIN